MGELLQQIYDYRRIISSTPTTSTLRAVERDRLRTLERALGWNTDASEIGIALRRRHARREMGSPAGLKVGDAFEPVTILNLSGGGLVVSPAPRFTPGDRTVVRVVAFDQRREYRYPAIAMWRATSRAGARLGLMFDGPPIELRLGGGVQEMI